MTQQSTDNVVAALYSLTRDIFGEASSAEKEVMNRLDYLVACIAAHTQELRRERIATAVLPAKMSQCGASASYDEVAIAAINQADALIKALNA